MLYVIGWIVFGFLGGWIAAKKGYSPMHGVLFGALGGPCALAIAAMMPSTEEGRQQDAIERHMNRDASEFNKRRACPSCREEISARATVCGLCGHHIN